MESVLVSVAVPGCRGAVVLESAQQTKAAGRLTMPPSSSSLLLLLLVGRDVGIRHEVFASIAGSPRPRRMKMMRMVREYASGDDFDAILDLADPEPACDVPPAAP